MLPIYVTNEFHLQHSYSVLPMLVSQLTTSGFRYNYIMNFWTKFDYSFYLKSTFAAICKNIELQVTKREENLYIVF